MFSLASLLVIVLEETIVFHKDMVIDLISHFKTKEQYDAQKILILLSGLMSYMMYVCFSGVFFAKVLGYYEFYKGKTTSSTLLNSAYYISRFTPPICFNLLTLTFGSNKSIEETSFFRVASASPPEHRRPAHGYSRRPATAPSPLRTGQCGR